MISKGDLHAAQVVPRRAVSQDPQNGQAHYWLGGVSFDLGDPVAGETQARAAQARDYEPLLTLRLLGQALLAQAKFDAVLATMQLIGTDAKRDAMVQVLRGYALMGEQKLDAAETAFEAATRLDQDAVEPPLAELQCGGAEVSRLSAGEDQPGAFAGDRGACRGSRQNPRRYS